MQMLTILPEEKRQTFWTEQFYAYNLLKEV